MKSILIMTSAFVLALCILRCVSGCNANSLDQWKKTRDQIATQLVATTQSIQDIQKQIDTLPDGEMKTKAQNALRAAQDLAPQLSEKLTSLDQMIQSAASGDSSTLSAGVTGLLSGLPVIGPYAAMIGLLAGMGFGAWQRIKRQKEVNQAVTAAKDLEEKLKIAQSTTNAGS
jgi:hypothetical protein